MDNEENEVKVIEEKEEQAAEVASETPEEKAQETDAGEQNNKKLLTALGYVPCGLLFFLPLLLFSEDKSAKFHANQALVLLLTGVIGGAVFGILSVIPFLSIASYILSTVFGVLMLVLSVIGILNVARGEEKRLPVIGGINIIK